MNVFDQSSNSGRGAVSEEYGVETVMTSVRDNSLG